MFARFRLLYTIIGFGAAALVAFLCANRPTGSSAIPLARFSTEGARPSTAAPAQRSFTAEDLRQALSRGDWDPASARAVADLHAAWFTAVFEDNAVAAHRQLTLFKDLGKLPGSTSFLLQHPELAGLLAGARDPDRLARVLNHAGSNYELFVGLYTRHADSEDHPLLTEALERHGSLIARLTRRGLLAAELSFLFPHDGEATEEYDRWLAAEWETLLDGATADEQLPAFQSFVLEMGPVVRERLRGDPLFRRRFVPELWPRLSRIAGPDSTWALYAGEPHVWDLLALPEGEDLLRNHGMLPVYLLFDQGAYHPDLHPRIRRALRENDRLLLQGYGKFRDEPQYASFLRRHIPDTALRAGTARLLAAGPGYPARLKYFTTLGDTTLVEELGPPPEGVETWLPLYSLYYVGRKTAQGRETDTLDWTLAGVDVVTTLVPLLRGIPKGPAKIVLKATAEEALQKTLREESKDAVTKQLGKWAAGKAVRIGAEEVAGMVTRATEKGLEHEGLRFGMVTLLQKFQQPLAEASIRWTTVEITTPTRLLFRYSGLGRATFQRMTGLEARLFMRGDARVMLRMDRTPFGKSVQRLVASWNEKMADEAADRVLAPPSTRESKQSLAAWLLLNASGVN